MKILILLLTLISGDVFASEIAGVPFVKQASGFCGPASLASVMSFYGADIDQQTIGEAVYCEGLKGSLITDLDNYAKAGGFKTRLGTGNLQDIKNFIEQKKPVIVLVDMGFWVVSQPHYLVVTGYADNSVIAHTGYEASRHFSDEDFVRIWKKKGSAYLVIHP